MTQPHEPYRSHTPWTGFTPREKRRAKPLARCPAAACRRAKHCIRAADALYCRRTHLTVAEARFKAPRRNPLATPWPTLPANASLEQVEMYRIANDMLVAKAEENQARMVNRWKAGALDHLYGPYDPKGVVMKPPPKEYVE